MSRVIRSPFRRLPWTKDHLEPEIPTQNIHNIYLYFAISIVFKKVPGVGLCLYGLAVGIRVGLVDVVAGLGQREEGQQHGDGQSEDAP